MPKAPISLQSNPLLSRRQKGLEKGVEAEATGGPSLQSNPLLKRREKLLALNTDVGAPSQPAKGIEESKVSPVSLQSNPLLSRRQNLGQGREAGSVSLQRNSLLSRPSKFEASSEELAASSVSSHPPRQQQKVEGEASNGAELPPVASLSSNSLLSRRQKSTESEGRSSTTGMVGLQRLGACDYLCSG